MGNFARSIININDLSTLVTLALSGVNAVYGVTERGDDRQTQVVRSWEEYTRFFGGLLPEAKSLFPLYCKRILDGGGVIRVGRLLHRTDQTDADSVTSTKATQTLGGAFPFSQQVIAFDETANTVTVVGDITPFLAPADTVNLVLTGGGSTAKTVSTVTKQGNYTVIEVATLNAGDIDINGRVTWTYNSTPVLTVRAKEYGAFGNTIGVTVKPATNGAAGFVDFEIYPTDYPQLKDTIQNVDATTASTAGLQALTDSNRWVEFVSNAGTVEVQPRQLLVAGADDIAGITALDVAGDADAMTGLHMFDQVRDFVRLAVPEFAQNGVDVIVRDYVAGRGDCMGVLRVPTGITNEAAKDYRNATGTYTGGQKLDEWFLGMFMSDIEVVDEYDGTTKFIPSMPDVLARMTVKDINFGAWWSFSGFQNKSGFIRATTGVGDKNLDAPFREALAIDLAANGLNFVVDKFDNVGQRSTWAWGNSSLQTANTLLKFFHVAELVIYLKRVIKPLMDAELFKPNNVDTWRNLYRAVSKLLDSVVSRQGITAYTYEGDQFVDDISQVTINDVNDINNGIYKFKVTIQPTPKAEIIELTLTVTDNLISVELATVQP